MGISAKDLHTPASVLMVKLGVGEHWPEEKQSPADKLLTKQPLDSTRIFALDNLSERQNKFSAEVLVKYLFIYS